MGPSVAVSLMDGDIGVETSLEYCMLVFLRDH